MKKLSSLFVSLLLSACATGQGDLNRMTGGQPPEYQDGFGAGCDSGYVAAGHPYYSYKKDAARADSDRLYASGWNDGFNVCKGKYESVQRSMRR